MPYLPLDPHRSEIRVLSLSQETTSSGLVECTLEQVSLDDFTPKYKDYIAEVERENSEPVPAWRLFNGWVEISTEVAKSAQPSDLAFSIPSWRWLHHTEFHNRRGITENKNDINAAFQSRLCHQNNVAEPEDIEHPDVLILPRYVWGDFEALSYCWESEDLEKEIILDGEMIKVPRNLKAALQMLRSLPETKSGMKFWADYLCIDQKTITEKNHQVKLMRKIYASTMSVIAWIGSEENRSDQAIELMGRIDMATGNKYAVKQICASSNSEVQESTSIFTDDSTVSLLTGPLKPLEALLNRNYWKRLWIIQELALSQSMTLFVCGNKFFSRRMIARTCYFCQDNSASIDTILRSYELANQDSASDLILWNGGIWSLSYKVKDLVLIGNQNQDDLEFVLDIGRKASAKEEKDKIYGLLGLLPEKVQAEIMPDYDLSVGVVYTNFVKSWLAASSRLDTFLSWCSFRDDAFAPSWVPDWTKPFSRHHLQWLKRRNTSKDTLASWYFRDCSKYLNCTGIIVDSIITTSNKSSDTNYRKSPPTLSQSVDLTQSNRYGSENATREALQRTLTIDHPYSNEGSLSILDIYWIDWNAINKTGDDLTDLWCYGMLEIIVLGQWWWAFDSFRQANASFSVLGYPFWQFFRSKSPFSTEDPPSLKDLLASDMRRATLSLTDRILITTKTGYLGLAPKETRVETHDVVAILYGCNFPVVLRPQEDGSYKVIGECYVHGIMDGEIIDAKGRGEYQEVKITLS
jgi:Heterokaryon incompatibility protein (HET)